MAEDKKSFVLYADLLTVVEKLIIRDRKNKTNYAGELLYHILLYVNDKEPVPIDFIIEMAFEPIKLQLKRDLRKYTAIKHKRSLAGKASAESRKNNSTESTSVESVDVCLTLPTVNDNVTVNVNGNVNGNVIESEETDHVFKFSEIYQKSWDEYYPLLTSRQSKELDSAGFSLWKNFVDFVIDNGFQQLFSSKFIKPVDFPKLYKYEKFTEDKWDIVCRKILATGIKPEHDLYFRIPEFMNYSKNKINGNKGSINTELGRTFVAD